MERLDCAIIGGGPVGLNAALVLGRARRSVVLFDNNEIRNSVTHESHGYITQDGVSPSEFRERPHQDLGSILPEIDGIHEYYGKSLFSYPYCDGWELRDRPLIVIAMNEHAYHLTTLLYNWSKDLLACTNVQAIT